jgi:uncharacterized protein with FMN-binding domain
MKRKGRRKMWIVIFVILGVLVAVIVGGILSTAPGRREVMNLTINNIDFSKLRDGTYEGEFIGTKDHLRDTKVQVTISSGKISDIKIIKGAINKSGQPAELTGGLSMEDVYGKVKESETLQVDTISGATLTTKTHLKALENALKKAEMH